MASNVDIQSRFVNALRTQAKTAKTTQSNQLPCPYCTHQGQIFQDVDQLLNHAEIKHVSILQTMETGQARVQVRNAAMKL
jgi:hypothetical protein